MYNERVNWGKQLLTVPLDVIVELMPLTELQAIYQRLKQKFYWLINYEESLQQWKIMVFLTRTKTTQLKIDGLNQQCLEQFESQISSIIIPPDLFDFKQKIIKYISEEISHLKTGNPVLATTDVVESIFGKYKHFSSRCPLKDFRQMLLTIPLSTMTFTTDVVKNALENIRGIDLEEWVHQVFGQSMLSKRKTLFSAASSDMKSA